MSESSVGSAANSTSRPDAAAGDMPTEPDLPRMQGLDSGVAPAADNAEPGAPGLDADRGDQAGSVSGTGTEGTGTSGSDPMPDMSGTGGA